MFGDTRQQTTRHILERNRRSYFFQRQRRVGEGHITAICVGVSTLQGQVAQYQATINLEAFYTHFFSVCQITAVYTDVSCLHLGLIVFDISLVNHKVQHGTRQRRCFYTQFVVLYVFRLDHRQFSHDATAVSRQTTEVQTYRLEASAVGTINVYVVSQRIVQGHSTGDVVVINSGGKGLVAVLGTTDSQQIRIGQRSTTTYSTLEVHV